MANCGDEKALAGIREYVRHLAIQINNYKFILDPEKIVIGGGISVQPLFLQMIKEEIKKINTVYPWDLPIADVEVCKFFNDANLIGAVYVHIKFKERKIDVDKLNEFLDLVKDRREGQYLMELLL
ncbi:ROK family protein [Lacrimispora sp. 38-1]|uniref:ROK family protein n=1 Tax=Lacrimispora sp. 38-1 TaxID=3125778 RepID=UPI003CEC4725